MDQKRYLIPESIDEYITFKKVLVESDVGGVSSPMSTLNNTPGMGNVQPASTAATSGAQQNSPDAIGSGDNFGNNIGKTHTQDPSTKKKKKKKKKKRKTTKKNESYNIETLDSFIKRKAT